MMLAHTPLTWDNGCSAAVQGGNPGRPLTRSLDLTEEGLAMEATRACSDPSCDRPAHTRGMCSMHYQRAVRAGLPLGQWRTLETRLWARLVEAPSGCWEWQGATSSGYGTIRYDGRTQYVHRVTWQELRSEIPDGLELDHLCKNTRCANPWHLDPVTSAVNLARSTNPASTHRRAATCKNGHPKTTENVYISPTGRRQCQPCKLQRARDWHAAHPEGVAS